MSSRMNAKSQYTLPCAYLSPVVFPYLGLQFAKCKKNWSRKSQQHLNWMTNNTFSARCLLITLWFPRVMRPFEKNFTFWSRANISTHVLVHILEALYHEKVHPIDIVYRLSRFQLLFYYSCSIRFLLLRITITILGCGNRGGVYASYSQKHPDECQVE
jgi:hypothetical protein